MTEPVTITKEELAIAMAPKERRRTFRHPFGRVAAIMFGQGKEHPCLVKDYSDGGVRLQPKGFEVPDDFALLFAPNEPARSGRYKVVWRLGKDVGAKFIGPASFPHFDAVHSRTGA